MPLSISPLLCHFAHMLEKVPAAVGRALQSHRAGLEATVFHQLASQRKFGVMELGSAAFLAGGVLPARFSADGRGASPPLNWRSAAASDVQSAVLIVEDADSPTAHPLVHVIAVNLPITGELEEAALSAGEDPQPAATVDGVAVGKNSFLRHAWLPPDPPPGHGVHRYVFQLFGLRGDYTFSRVPGRGELFDAVTSHAVAAGLLIGTYERPADPHAGRERS